MIHIDDDELHALEVDISKAPGRIQRDGQRATARAARVIDRAMTEDATGHIGNYFGIPGTDYVTPLEKHVSHEMLGPLSAEIGIEKKGAGKLAHIIVFGSVNNAPVYDHMAGPRRVLPIVEEIYADATETAVIGGEK